MILAVASFFAGATFGVLAVLGILVFAFRKVADIYAARHASISPTPTDVGLPLSASGLIKVSRH